MTTRGDAQRFYRDVVLTCERGPEDECLIWPFSATKGYGIVQHNGRTQVVSRLACTEANGQPPTPEYEAAHSCGRGKFGCVTKGHLSWKTPKDNSADTIIHGTSNRGERQGRSKLTAADVHQIRAMRGKVPQKIIANSFGITQSNASHIQRGKSWSWLTEVQQ